VTASCAIDFLRRAVAWFSDRGVRIQAVMSDNGSAYVAHAYATRSPSSACATCAPSPTGPAPTERQNA
jgi:hypothetical protein